MPGSIRIERIVLARFEVIDIIGVGGEGEVLKAIDTIPAPSLPSNNCVHARATRPTNIRWLA
jgi:hypothetical protein